VIYVQFSPDGRRLFTASGDGKARLWDESRRLLEVFTYGGKNQALAAFSADGGRLVTAWYDGKARLWDGRSGKPINELDHKRVSFAAFRPDGKVLVKWHGGGRLWNAGGEPLRTLEATALGDLSRHVRPRRLASGSGDRGRYRSVMGCGRPFPPGVEDRGAEALSGATSDLQPRRTAIARLER
jgi:WD40 repeat protein